MEIKGWLASLLVTFSSCKLQPVINLKNKTILDIPIQALLSYENDVHARYKSEIASLCGVSETVEGGNLRPSRSDNK
jgi:hypothetical protein